MAIYSACTESQAPRVCHYETGRGAGFSAPASGQKLLLIGLCLLLFAPGAAAGPEGKRESAAALLISEVYYDTPGVDENEEWIEVANVGQLPISLSGYKIGDAAEAGQSEGMFRFPAGAMIAAGEAIVIAQSSVGFRALYGRAADYEIRQTEASVPEMEAYVSWSSGALALNNEGDEVVLLAPDDLIADAVNYGKSTTFFRPSVNDVPRGHSIERQPARCDGDVAADWQPRSVPTPGRIALGGSCTREDATARGLQSIGQIQGAGSRSPYINQIVHFRGIVTGVLEDRNLRGATFYTVFIQDSAGDADGDRATSDAIAVFVGARRPDILPGDAVTVSGQVTEFYGLTEIDDDNLSIRILSSGHRLPRPEAISLATGEGPIDFEPLEAMRVAVANGLVVGPTHAGCGFALADGDLPAANVIRRKLQNAVVPILPVLNHSDVNCEGFPAVKVGDWVQGVQGPLTYHFDQFKIVQQPIEPLEVISATLPPEPEPLVVSSNALVLASFNLHDHFDAHQELGNEAEPLPTPQEVATKRTKLARVIADALACPSILAIQEVENATLLGELAVLLSSSCGFTYDVSHRESADARGIDVALLSEPRRVEVGALILNQTCSTLRTEVADESVNCPVGQHPLFSRPPLQVEARVDDLPVTIFVTHFKSKRDGESETHGRRMAQARYLASLLAHRLTKDRTGRIMVLGDFNDYELSLPLTTMTQEVGMINAMSRVPLLQRYTYNFGGVSQLLDGILLSPTLAQEIVGAHIVHVNADFPASWGSDEKRIWRSSDHDVPVVILEPKTSAVPAPNPSAEQRPPSDASVMSSTEAEDHAVAPSKRPTVFWPMLFLSAGVVALIGLAVRLLAPPRR